MDATQKSHSKREHKTPQRQKTDKTVLIIAILTALPPLILAIDKLVKTGHTIGWW